MPFSPFWSLFKCFTWNFFSQIARKIKFFPKIAIFFNKICFTWNFWSKITYFFQKKQGVPAKIDAHSHKIAVFRDFFVFKVEVLSAMFHVKHRKKQYVSKNAAKTYQKAHKKQTHSHNLAKISPFVSRETFFATQSPFDFCSPLLF